MMWRCCLAALVCSLMAVSAAAQQSKSATLTDVQAADLMSELLTYYGDLANRRIDAMRAFIADIGKKDDYEIKRPAAPARKEITFAEAFKGTIQFVEQGGAKYADPALAKMSPADLQKELEALQHYNLQQFLYLNTQRDEAARMRVYLESIGQFDEYLKWAQVHAPRTLNLLTTAPTTQDAQAFARWLGEEVGAMKARAWQRAQAQGMSQEQFDKQWEQKKDALEADINQRVEGVKLLGAHFAPRSGLPQGPPASSSAGVSLPPLPGAPPANARNSSSQFQGPPVTANDPRWQPYYYGPNNRFNGWNDDYSDVWQPNASGGVYRAYDTRVNQDYDVRVNGELDRRVNTSFDRRQNIQIDPKVNF